MKNPKLYILKTARRLSQAFFLILFLFLLFKAEFRGTFDKEIQNIRIDYPVSIFLEADPLVAISTAISTHTLYQGLKWSVIVLVLTFILGRFICGWVCPLGTLNHLLSFSLGEKKRKERVKSNRYQNWQTIKYSILILMLAAAFLTTLQTGLLDPICFLTRSLTTSILPAIGWLLEKISGFLLLTNIHGIQKLSDSFFDFSEKYFLSVKQPYFHISYLLGAVFILVLALNRRIMRFWCRALCPLGALMGIASWSSIFGMEKKHERCTDCNLCLVHCQGACEPIGRVKWKAWECHICFNCRVVCPEDVIRFKFFPKDEAIESVPDLSRRRILRSASLGLIILPFSRVSDEFKVNYNSRLIRPPGSLEEKEFLARCIKCGECMKVCPNNAIHPSLLESGIEGIWSPIIIPRIGYCEYTCVLCSQVCPTGAIKKITEEEKLGIKTKKPIKIGLAFYDKGRCLPWSMATPCIVCEEWCPTPKKAIWLEETLVTSPSGEKIRVKLPYVNPELCNGCGACETKCPVADRPAVYVTSIGESRSKTNQILLNPYGKK
ncbi:MAG: hypothetical protein A3C43_04665 [Candidatus Schekmanbacteria bacterium RIFCSPHIGHO2_02_FULL_38_11]|nr:MAG: hypothetical protein A3C43_04665 [Candidatus Schekmanbacteria bacterium RIFCSPHIGHO2_02_FULL_38_11]